MKLTEAKKRHRAGGNKSKRSRNRKAEDKQSPRQLKGHLMQRAAKLRSERAELAKELAGCADSVDPELTNRDRQHLRQAIIGEDDAQSDLYSKMATNANRREFEFNEQQGQLSLDLASQLMRTRDNSALERERRSDTPPVFETVSGPTYLADAHFRSRSDPSLAGTGSHCSPFAVWPVPKRCKKIVSEDEFWDNISAFQCAFLRSSCSALIRLRIHTISSMNISHSMLRLAGKIRLKRRKRWRIRIGPVECRLSSELQTRWSIPGVSTKTKISPWTRTCEVRRQSFHCHECFCASITCCYETMLSFFYAQRASISGR